MTGPNRRYERFISTIVAVAGCAALAACGGRGHDEASSNPSSVPGGALPGASLPDPSGPDRSMPGAGSNTGPVPIPAFPSGGTLVDGIVGTTYLLDITGYLELERCDGVGNTRAFYVVESYAQSIPAAERTRLEAALRDQYRE
jgi:hypothetical protein